ncbi:hypothetical protein PybrP1_005169 [[Pythium] brassicae (nom. inval.)]|nr:hypothetical protein PybrP1_005169 [[Pythium] brassicae (nom. inval.)]
MDMEEELTAQRDAAIAVTKELQRQLVEVRADVERRLERRALTAERLRLHAEAELRRVRDESAWERRMHARVLYLSLFTGVLGALAGWCLGLQLLLLFNQPLVGFLLILPAMLFGGLVGLAIAKTKMQLESRQRDAKRKRVAQHTEVELALLSSLDADDAPLSAFEGVPGLASDEVRDVNRNAAAAASGEDPTSTLSPSAANASSPSLLVRCAGFAWQTLRVTTDVALSMYYTKDPMRGALDPDGASSAAGRKPKEQ